MIQDLLDADGLTRAGFDEARWFRFVEKVVETLDAGPGTRVLGWPVVAPDRFSTR